MEPLKILEMGMQLVIRKDLDKRNIEYRTRIVGWDKNNYVIVELPMLNGVHVRWDNGVSCTAKFLSGKKLFSFRTTCIKSITTPVALMFIKFPTKIENATTREHERMQTYMNCSAVPVNSTLEKRKLDLIDADDLKDNAVLRDFSSGGGLLEIESTLLPVTVHDLLSLTFSLPNGTKITDLIVEVRNIRIESGRKLLGIKFTDKHKNQLQLVENFFTAIN